MIRIEDLLYDKELYTTTKKSLLEDIFVNGEYQEQKNALVDFSYKDEEYQCSAKEFTITLVLMQVFIDMEAQECYSDDFMYSLHEPKLEHYLDKFVKFFRAYDVQKLTDSLSEVLIELSKLAAWTNLITGVTISLYELYQMAKHSERLNEILQTDLSSVQSFSEMEQLIDSLSAEAIKIICSFENSSYKDMIESGVINKNQFKQVVASIGPRPSITGQIIPEIINTNFLSGLRNIQDYYILMETARKILIISHIQVRKSGYLTRKLSLLTYDTLIDGSVEDCGTTHYMPVEIHSQDRLLRYLDRWFWDYQTESVLLLSEELIQERGEEFFIGTTMYFRSPMLCACPEGKTCRTCYGELYHVNKEYHEGLLAILILCPRIMQLLLSAKHLLQTKSQEFDWPQIFLDFFYIDQTEVIGKEDIRGYLRIDESDLREDEENGSWYFNRCTIDSPATGLRAREEHEIELPTELYLTDELMSELQNNKDGSLSYFEITLKNYPFQTLFYQKILNEEITARLDHIKVILEDSAHAGRDSYDGLLDEALNMLEKNGIPLNAVHMELILKNLLKDAADPSRPADWSQDEPAYQLVTLFGSIINGFRLTPGISFEEVKSQIFSPDTYKKTGKSLMDAFYKG